MNKKIQNILKKKNKTKIVSLTAYSKNIAQILDKHVDIVLVGDSMANVLYGHKNTHQISLDNIIQHTSSVRKGVKKSLLVVDMPKGSYNDSKSALRNFALTHRAETPFLDLHRYGIRKFLKNFKFYFAGLLGLNPDMYFGNKFNDDDFLNFLVHANVISASKIN